jgi:DNA-binding XRE family transcriptional regulator
MIIELEIGGGHLIVRGENLSISVTEAGKTEAATPKQVERAPGLGGPSFPACMRLLGLTDQALADKVGCSRTIITKLRHNKITASLPLAIRIVRVTGCHIEDLCAPEKLEPAE